MLPESNAFYAHGSAVLRDRAHGSATRSLPDMHDVWTSETGNRSRGWPGPCAARLFQCRTAYQGATRSLSSIRVNAISPGFIGTEMVKAMKPEALAKLSAMIPAGRIGEPVEIAHTVQYIIENDFVNGRNIEVDGGMRL